MRSYLNPKKKKGSRKKNIKDTWWGKKHKEMKRSLTAKDLGQIIRWEMPKSSISMRLRPLIK